MIFIIQMATWILRDNGNSYFYVHSITKMLTARPDNRISVVMYPHFLYNDITKMVSSSKIVISAEMILMLLVIS